MADLPESAAAPDADDTLDLGATLDTIFRLDPGAPELLFQGEWLTWGELAHVGTALLEAVEKAGVPSECAIGLVTRNRPFVVAAMLGILRARRSILPLNALLPDAASATDVHNLRPAVIAADGADWARPEFRAAAGEVGALGLELTGHLAEPVRGLEGLGFDPSLSHHAPAPGTATSMLTSGTTGGAKRIDVLSQSLGAAWVAASKHHGGKNPGASPKLRAAMTIVELPLFNITAFGELMMAVMDGRQVGLLERFDPVAWGELVRDHNVVAGLLVPAAMRMFLDADIPKEWLEGLKVVRSGTAPLDQATAVEWDDKYGIPLIQAYGATEFSGALTSLTIKDVREWGRAKLGTVGRPHPGIELRVVDPADGRVLEDEVGILEARMPSINGRDEWIRTSDLARIDADGFLYIHGRADDVIIRGGFKIDVNEVARVLAENPAVRSAAVVGLPDARLGQVPGAAVVLEDGVAAPPTEDELKLWVRERLTPYSVPTKIMVLPELPRTPTMKVSQVALRELLTA